MPSRRAVVTLPMVMKLARSAARLCLFSEIRASSCCTATVPRSRTTRRSGSASRRASATFAKPDTLVRMSAPLRTWVSRTIRPSSMRRVVCGQRLGRGGGQGVARVDEPLQVRAAALERLGRARRPW